MLRKNLLLPLLAGSVLTLSACGSGSSARSPEGTVPGSGNGGGGGTIKPMPVIAANDAATAEEGGSPVLIPVLANDADDDPSSLFIVPGSVTTPTIGTATISGNQIEYTPASSGNGNVNFQYTVEDADGNRSTATVTVAVQASSVLPQFPVIAVADASVGMAVAGGSPININVLANDIDDDTSTLMVTAVTQPTSAAQGSVANNGANVTFTPGASSGVVTFSYTVTDADGNSNMAQVTVVVLPIGINVPVQAIPDVDIGNATSTGGPISIDVLANDIDDDPSTLILRSVTSVTPAGPSAMINAGQVDFDPMGSTGIFTFMYTVEDSGMNQSTGLVTVVVSPDLTNGVPVVAVPDVAVTDSGTPTTIDVLMNDLDDDTSTLTIFSVGTPTFGTATINAGQIDFDPMGTFGPSTFSYVVQDNDGNQSSANVVVAVTPSPSNGVPVVAVADVATVVSNQTVTINVLSNDIDDATGTLMVTLVDPAGTPFGSATIVGGATQVQFDPDGNIGVSTLNYTVTDADGNSSVGAIAVVSTPVLLTGTAPVAIPDTSVGAITSTDGPTALSVLSNDIDDGTLTVFSVDANTTPAGPILANTGSDVTFDPNGNTGIFTFNYTVQDDDNNQASALVTVIVSPDLSAGVPVVAILDVSIGAATANAGAVNIDLVGNDLDDDMSTLRVTDITGLPSGVTATIDGDETGVDFNPGSNSGLITFMYEVTDSDNLSSTATVNVLVAPDLSAGVPVQAVPDVVATGATAGGPAVPIDVLLNDLDDGAASTLTVTAINTPNAPASGMVAIVNPGTPGNSITFTPGAAGVQTFNYTVTDADNNMATGLVTVIVTPAVSTPLVVAVPDVVAPPIESGGGANGMVTIAVLTNDLGSGLSINSVTVASAADGTAVINGTAIDFTSNTTIGAVTFDYEITDGTSTSTATVTVPVLPPAGTIPVIAVADVGTQVSAGGGSANTVNIPVLMNDIGTGLSIQNIMITAADGTAVVDGGGTGIDFTSNTNSGLIMFTYEATDGTTSSTGTVSVPVLPATGAPVVIAVPDVATPPVQSGGGSAGMVSIPVLSNDIGSGLSIGTITIAAADGTAVANGGNIDFTSNTATGIVTFTYEITDGTSTSTANVVVPVTPPTGVSPVVAVLDVAGSPVGVGGGSANTINIPVLSNDVGTGLSITNIVIASGDGTAVVDGGGTGIDFTSGANSGLITFTYDATDGTTSSTATVTVAVTPDGAPAVIQAVPDVVTTAIPSGGGSSGMVTIPVLANDVGAGLSIDLVTVGTGDGSATINGSSIDYTSGSNSGLIMFTYRITNGTTTSSAAVTVPVTAPVGTVPVVAVDDIAPGSVSVGGGGANTINIPVLSNDLGTGLTISNIIVAAADGSAVVDGGGTGIDFTSNTNSGFIMFTYDISDGSSSDTGTVTVTVTPAPTGVPIATIGGLATVSLAAGTTAINLVVLDDDPTTAFFNPANPTVTGTGLSPGAGSAVGVNTGGVFTIDFTPSAVGTVDVSYTVEDADGNTASGVIEVLVTL